MNPQVYQIPAPPSTNAIWRAIPKRGGGARVIKSEVYRDWLRHAGATIVVQRRQAGSAAPMIILPIPVAVHLDIGQNNRRDLDGYLKPILDLLQYSKVIENDKQVKTIHMDWAEGVTDCRIEVWPIADYAAKPKLRVIA